MPKQHAASKQLAGATACRIELLCVLRLFLGASLLPSTTLKRVAGCREPRKGGTGRENNTRHVSHIRKNKTLKPAPTIAPKVALRMAFSMQ